MMGNPVNDIDAILITGPTASGKSALAVELAKQNGGEVINADSMQVYDTLRVLTARPADDDMKDVEHHLYGHVAAGQPYSTGLWVKDISQLLQRLKSEGRVPVIVGGTGLYFKALTGGLSDMPEVPAEIRAMFRQRLVEQGAELLHRELGDLDPAMAATLNPQDGQRIVRALEVLEATGKSIGVFQRQVGPTIVDANRAHKIVVLPDRSILQARINARFETMLETGAVDEVQALLSLHLPPEMPVMKAIGVTQISAMIEGRMSRAEVIETAAAATRQYAKRQMTWFRNQMDESWERRG
jgi:tRNA dimethylallyltransferase